MSGTVYWSNIEVDDFVLARSEFDPNGPLELKRVEEKCRPEVLCATSGFVVGLLRSHPDHFHQPQSGFNIKAQGRAAHPGIAAPDTREPQRGSTSQPMDALIGSRL